MGKSRQAGSDALRAAVLIIWLGVSLFPSRALAFTNEVESSHLELMFVRDPQLASEAIVGIEAWPQEQTVAQILKSPSMAADYYPVVPGTTMRVLSTAYSSTADQTDISPFITASGLHTGPGVIAANWLPLGTQVRIGQQIYTVWDRMNSRYNGKYVLDIWKPTRTQALNYGVRIIKVEIVSTP